MEFIVKTNLTPQTVLGREPYNIAGIRGRIFDIPLSLNDTELQASFYFEFLDEKEEVVGNINAYSRDIRSKVKASRIAAGDTEEVATSTSITITDQIIQAIIAGSKSQRYAAMQQFAGVYSLTLLPLEDQNGVLVVEEPPIEPQVQQVPTE